MYIKKSEKIIVYIHECNSNIYIKIKMLLNGMRKNITRKGRIILKRNYSLISTTLENMENVYVKGYFITTPILFGHRVYEEYKNNRYGVKMTSDRAMLSIIAGLIISLVQGIAWPITVPCTIYDITMACRNTNHS